MRKVVIQTDRSDYLYHFFINHNKDGTRTLTIKSQWTGAKNPDELQTRFQSTLGEDQWDELILMLHASLVNEGGLQ